MTNDPTDLSRRELLRRGSIAAGATVAGVGALSGTSLAGCTVDGCARTPGYWKNHPDAWHDENMDPITELTIGGRTYSKSTLLTHLDTPPRGGNKMIILVHALIATKLNVEGGTNDWCIRPPHFEVDLVEKADYWVKRNQGRDGIFSSVRRWDGGEWLYEYLDDYNNGELRCVCKGD